MMWTCDVGGGGWLLMSLTTVALWALVAVGLVALLRATRYSEGTTPPGPDDHATQILDERFARGEIGAEEYRARQDVLHPAR